MTSPFVHALPPSPSVVAVVDLGEHALVTWTHLGIAGVSRYDVYGIQTGQPTYLGSADALHAAFLAPGGFDGYAVVAVADGESRPVGTVCVSYRHNPPSVQIDWSCGRSGTLLSYHLP